MATKQRSRGQGTIFKRQDRGPWIMAYFDHTGKRKERSTRTTDRSAAERILNKHVADAALRRGGVIDAQLDAICDESKKPVESHLANYESKMRTACRKPKHIKTTIGYIRAIAEACSFVTAADINADGVNRYAGSLRDRNQSARTVQAYLTAIKGFTKWLAVNHKLPREPLASVTKPSPQNRPATATTDIDH